MNIKYFLTEKKLSKRIDNLPYSIKPEHYMEFKQNLIKSLCFRVMPNGPCFLEVLFSFYKRKMERRNVPFSLEKLLDHTIIVCSLMKAPFLTFTCDDIEYEITGTSEEYKRILWEPFS